jgi:hypothetical protein
MRRQQHEDHIRAHWMSLPKEYRERLVDVIIFKSDLVRNHSELLTDIEGDILAYVKGVFSGLYSTDPIFPHPLIAKEKSVSRDQCTKIDSSPSYLCIALF